MNIPMADVLFQGLVLFHARVDPFGNEEPREVREALLSCYKEPLVTQFCIHVETVLEEELDHVFGCPASFTTAL